MARCLILALLLADCLCGAKPSVQAEQPPAASTSVPPTPIADLTPDATVAQLQSDALTHFTRTVRPLLAAHCLGCHGEKKQHGGLRLDSRVAMLQGGDSGPVLDLEQPADSRLLMAIGYQNDELQMPPEPTGKLPDEAIGAIRNWVLAGAPWPQAPVAASPTVATKPHWAFLSPQAPAIPPVGHTAWPRSPIDHFVLARLEAAGLEPGEPADRATLIRRASFDLIGLPPSEAEIAAFVADSAPDAFARVIDRLLDSPHYGERWGRYWLDLARYADTKGYVRLQEERRFHYAFTYRDYVIRAFNEDLPYDRFVEQQLAADQLPPVDGGSSLAALGFLTLGRRFTGNRHDILDDRIDVTTRGLLGLTVTCARCHDHKYDPIPTADYYSLYGVFGSSDDPRFPQPIAKTAQAPTANDPATQAFERELATRQQALDAYEPPQYATLVDEFRSRSADYLVAALAGRQPPQQPLPKAAGEIRQIVVERWIDFLDEVPADDSVFGLWRAWAALKPADFAASAAAVLHDHLQPTGGKAAPANALILKHFAEQPPQSMEDVARGYGQLLATAHIQWQKQQSAAIAAATALPGALADPAAEALRQVLYRADAPVAVSADDAVADYLYDGPIQDEVVKRRNRIHEHLAQTRLAPPRAHTLVENPLARDARILVRGNPTRPGRHVPRQFLSVLSGTQRQPFTPNSARLELARAITDRDNPLTARVMVNRVWAGHFGAGLVRTPSNFGLRGELPTHPELLDYLALRFMDDDWSLKKLHRAILLTSTYQQASTDRVECAQRDPENRLLWKMNRRRLDFEAQRDSMLWVAGTLDTSLGGPGVDLADLATRRRTIYGTIDRQAMPSVLATFDFACPDAHSPQRYTTTVPQQALFLMNSPWMHQAARTFATRADVQALGDPAQRIARMVQLAWGRLPTPAESELALQFVQAHAADVTPPANETNPATTAAGAATALDAWAALAQTLLLSNEFCHVD